MRTHSSVSIHLVLTPPIPSLAIRILKVAWSSWVPFRLGAQKREQAPLCISASTALQYYAVQVYWWPHELHQLLCDLWWSQHHIVLRCQSQSQSTQCTVLQANQHKHKCEVLLRMKWLSSGYDVPQTKTAIDQTSVTVSVVTKTNPHCPLLPDHIQRFGIADSEKTHGDKSASPKL